MASEDRHITRIKDTEANVRANLDLAQSAILSDQNEEWVYNNDDASKLYYMANQKYWNGAAITYCDVDFNEIEAHSDILVNEYIKRASGTDDRIRFENDKITVDAGGTTAFIFEDDQVYTALNLGINTGGTAPLGGIEIKDDTFLLTDSDVAHGVTDYAPTTAYGKLEAVDGLAGGLEVNGISEGSESAYRLWSILGTADPSDTLPAAVFCAAKSDGGTGIAALGSAETCFQYKNNTTVLLTMLGGEKVGIGSDATVPAELLEVRKNQNASTSIKVTNSTNDTSAAVAFTAASADSTMYFGAYPSNYTDISNLAGFGGIMAHTDCDGLALLATKAPNGDAGGYIDFYTGGATAADIKMTLLNGLKLKEVASADADTAAYGQFWVKTASPNYPMFTDDAGTDKTIIISDGGTGGSGSAGAGNQYIEMEYQGTVYKVLHDGTV